MPKDSSVGWRFPSRCVVVVDGDTLEMESDLGFGATITQRVRLLGLNAPELHGASHPRGVAAKEYVERWMASHAAGAWPLTLSTTKPPKQDFDKFGRYLGVVVGLDDPVTLNDALLRDGLAVPYDGHGPRA